jgi:hypothetical protein
VNLEDIEMKAENAEAIVEKLNDDGIEAEVYTEYSGRGMFGRTTTGVVTGSVADVAYAMGSLKIEDSRRTDNMGLDMIVY